MLVIHRFAVMVSGGISMNPRHGERIIRPAELIKRLGITKVTLWRMRKRFEIPEPLRFSSNAIGWRESTIERWLDEREAEASQARAC